MRSLPRSVTAALAVSSLLAACAADAPVVEEVPVARAEAVDFEDTPLEAPSPTDDDGDATDEQGPDEPGGDPTPEPSPTALEIGPTSADAAAFVNGDALTDLRDVEHVVVDLDGDTWAEVVATGIHDRGGVLRVAWWTVDGYEVLAEDRAGPGTAITDLRASDVNADDRVELLVSVEGDGLGSLAVWRVLRRGAIERLSAVGGCHDGSHVYGVTRARLEGGAVPAIVADCDDSPLPVADWSEQRWAWQDGAYRVDPSTLPGAADEPQGEDEDAPDEDAASPSPPDDAGDDEGDGTSTDG